MEPRLRRAIVAVALGLLVHLAGVAGFGHVAAGTDEAVLPERLSVRPPRSGDAARYNATVSGMDAPTIRNVTASWGPPTWVRPRNGTPTAAMPLTVEAVVDDAGNRTDVRSQTAYWAPSTGAVEASHDRIEREKRPDRSLPGDEIRRIDRRVEAVTRLDDASAPCGFGPGLLGGPTRVDRPVDDLGACDPDEGAFHARRVENVAGVDAVVFEAPTGSAAWWSPTYPLPVRVEAPASTLVPKGDVERTVTLELTGFREGQGSGPEEAIPDRPDPRRPVDTAPTQPWGPPEGEAEHPFPLSAAWDVLVDRSEAARSYRDDHPDAYVGVARLREHVDATGRTRRYWRIVLTDGSSRLDRYVADPASEGPLPAAPTGADRVRRPDEVPFRPMPVPDAFPSPHLAPDRLPVVDDLLDRYRTLDPRPADTGEPDRWSLTVRCATSRCDRADVVVTAGRGSRRDAVSGDDSRVHLAVDGAGRRRGVDVAATVDGGVYVDSFHSAGSSPTAPSAVPAPSTWDRARWNAAAAAGALGLLAAAVYYLWPKVKLVGGSLYSRIGRDEVLDNETRRRIHDLVVEEPGIHFRELKRRLDVGRGALEHHLDKLVATDHLAESRSSGYRCYFPPGDVDRRVIDVADQLRSDNARALLVALDVDPGVSLRGLADRADVHESTASYHVDRLAEAGLIAKDRNGGSLAIDLTDLGRRAIEELDIA